MNTTRKIEIKAAMASFGKDTYRREEVLPEMFQLQSEMVSVVFNDSHADSSHLKIYDVERRLEQINEERGHIADAELEKYKLGCKTFCNLIKAQVSGNHGEAKAFRTLEFLKSNNVILKNIELSDDEKRTEIDAIVVTSKEITIVEVKNTSKNIFIDEDGNYFRTGEFLKWDSNIAEKMHLREMLLRKTLVGTAYEDAPITGIVVFTDSRITVQNKYSSLKTCFSSQLVHLIKDSEKDPLYHLEDIQAIKKAILQSEYKREYAFSFDVEQYKADFIAVVLKLEGVVEESQPVKTVGSEAAKYDTYKVFALLNRLLKSRYVRTAGQSAAAFSVSMLSTKVLTSIINHF